MLVDDFGTHFFGISELKHKYLDVWLFNQDE